MNTEPGCRITIEFDNTAGAGIVEIDIVTGGTYPRIRGIAEDGVTIPRKEYSLFFARYPIRVTEKMMKP